MSAPGLWKARQRPQVLPPRPWVSSFGVVVHSSCVAHATPRQGLPKPSLHPLLYPSRSIPCQSLSCSLTLNCRIEQSALLPDCAKTSLGSDDNNTFLSRKENQSPSTSWKIHPCVWSTFLRLHFRPFSVSPPSQNRASYYLVPRSAVDHQIFLADDKHKILQSWDLMLRIKSLDER